MFCFFPPPVKLFYFVTFFFFFFQTFVLTGGIETGKAGIVVRDDSSNCGADVDD